MSVTIGQGITLNQGVSIVPTSLVQHLDALDYTGSGTTWNARVGNNATLINAPTWNNTVGYFNFDPASLQYAEVASIGNLSTWTVECWYYLTASLTTTEATAVVTTVYENGAGTLYNAINYCIGNDYAATYSPYMDVGYWNGDWRQLPGVLTPSIGQWYQTVGTFDGITQTLTQYTNGISAGSISGYGPSTANGAPIRIARRWDGPEVAMHYFPGQVAIVKIYNAALSGASVLQNFNATKTRFGL
jgi:hypothetical protein